MEEPKIYQKKPIVETVPPGKYAWCACGRSEKQPYCDGSHKGTGIKPVYIEINEEKKLAWCGCKQSKAMPFCDGTHSKL